MKERIRVAYLGGIKPSGTDKIWGGAISTFNAFQKCFEDDETFKLVCKDRREFKCVSEMVDFLDSCSISQVDDPSALIELFKVGYQPDVIGPLVRSPVKNYAGWKAPYTPEYFYKSKVIRLNESEERGSEYLDKVNFINHGVDTKTLIPNNSKRRKYVLWAGNKFRDAKNYSMFEEIMKITQLPFPYEFKVMSQYHVEDYWKILDETAILVNTSKYESFCCAVAEARCKRVPVLVRKEFNGKLRFLDQPGQVEYTPEAYSKEILDILNRKRIEVLGMLNRRYVEKNSSLKVMRDSIAKVYYEVLNEI